MCGATFCSMCQSGRTLGIILISAIAVFSEPPTLKRRAVGLTAPTFVLPDAPGGRPDFLRSRPMPSK